MNSINSQEMAFKFFFETQQQMIQELGQSVNQQLAGVREDLEQIKQKLHMWSKLILLFNFNINSLMLILFLSLVSALSHLELSKNAELLEQTTNDLIDEIKAEIDSMGYMCWNRDQTLFTYALITARARKPSRGTRELEICSY